MICECDLTQVLRGLEQAYLTVWIGSIQVECEHGKRMSANSVHMDGRSVRAE